MPDCSTGAVIMKMISSTSTTSTSGVMLISASELCVLPLLLVKATHGLPFDRVYAGAQTDLLHAVQQFAGEVVESRAKLAQGRTEGVVSNHGRHSDKQAGSRGDERL